MSNNQRSSGFLAVRFTFAVIMVGLFFGLTAIGTNAQRASVRDRSGVSKQGVITTEQAQLVSTSIVINEVYGGAGCGTAGCSTYQNDFIELKNISLAPVSMVGWSVQYASATGTAWQVTPFTTVIQPGDTYLIAESFSTNGVSPLPTPNATGTIAMSSTGAKIALVNNSTALTGACPIPAATVIDFVGYGTTPNCSETALAPAPSTTTSVTRNAAGTDTDNNSLDFTAAAPTPRTATTPTAAGVSVSGRVLTADGRGITNVRMVVTGNSLAEAKVLLTGRGGSYLFTDLQAGETYVITVGSRRYTFSSPSRVLNLTDNATDIDFVAN